MKSTLICSKQGTYLLSSSHITIVSEFNWNVVHSVIQLWFADIVVSRDKTQKRWGRVIKWERTPDPVSEQNRNQREQILKLHKRFSWDLCGGLCITIWTKCSTVCNKILKCKYVRSCGALLLCRHSQIVEQDLSWESCGHWVTQKTFWPMWPSPCVGPSATLKNNSPVACQNNIAGENTYNPRVWEKNNKKQDMLGCRPMQESRLLFIHVLCPI